MRLICPNCDAQYEVDDAVIPAEGRDVQCSNCGNTWFQPGPGAEEPPATAPIEDEFEDEFEAEPEAEAEIEEAFEDEPEDQDDDQFDDAFDDDGDEVEPDEFEAALTAELEQEFEDGGEDTPAPKRKALDDSILEVLREEAERETQARRAEIMGGDPLEFQADLGLDESAATTSAAAGLKERVARLRGISPEAEKPSKPGARRDLLPDIEEINSTLRATSERKASGISEAVLENDPLPRRRGGFGLGFGIVVLAGALLAAIYLTAPKIATLYPGAAPALSNYVAVVNDLRGGLNHAVTRVMTNATGLLQKGTGS